MNAQSSLLTIVLTSVALGAVLAALVNGMFMAVAAARQRRHDLAVGEAERAHQLAMKQMELEHHRDLKALELRQQRMTTALALARFKHEQLMEAAKNAPGREISLWDPAVSLSDYLAALDEIERTGRWAKGDHFRGEDLKGRQR